MTYHSPSKEEREKLSRLIRQRKPWLKATGPKTPEGKRNAAMRAYKGAIRPKQRMIAKALRNQKKVLKELS